MFKRIAISNIAWTQEQEVETAKLLSRHDIRAVEVAPARIGATTVASLSEAARYRDFWKSHGMSICAMQALLYGAPAFELFGSKQSRDAMAGYLTRIIQIGGVLGAKTLVFGSPNQRQRKTMPIENAMATAQQFFLKLGAIAFDCGTKICIEPNPGYYNCDFINTVPEALELVSMVDSPGFGLHVDAAALRLSNEDPAVAIRLAKNKINHFHISEPDLLAVGIDSENENCNHGLCARALCEINYQGWLSIEMRAATNTQKQIVDAIDYAKAVYRKPVAFIRS